MKNLRGGGNAGQIKWKVAGQKFSQKLEIRFQYRNPSRPVENNTSRMRELLQRK